MRKVGLFLVMSMLTFTAAVASVNDLPVKDINGKKYYYYEVQPQETVYSLCRRFGITREQLIRCNPSVEDGLKAHQVLLFPVDDKGSSTASGVTEYVVQKGETGFGISRKFSMTLDEFYSLNPAARDGLKAGQKVKVRTGGHAEKPGNTVTAPKSTTPTTPAATSSTHSDRGTTTAKAATGGTHTIAQHETLYQIAQAHGLTLRELLDANPTLNPEHYEAGMVIVIPSKKTSPDVPTVTPPAPVKPQTETAHGGSYTVKEGDTFYGIAHAHGLSVEQLRAANADIDILKPGMLIALPQGCDDSQFAITHSSSADAQGVSGVSAITGDTVVIALALPFNAGAAQPDNRSKRATEFFRGFAIAVDSMRNTGRPIRLQVYDTKGTDEGVAAILADPGLKKASVIIAPDAAAQMQKFATFAEANKIYLLNLFVIKDTQYLTNPYIMHSNIPHAAMYDKAVDYFLRTFPDVTPVILKRTGGKDDKVEFVNKLKKKLSASGRVFHEIEYADRLSAATLEKLAKGKNYAFIPVSSNIDEMNKFIDAVTKYKESLTDGSVTLWGYAEWLTARGDNQAKLHKANTYIFSRFYSVEKDYGEEQLQTQFERWYGTRIMDKVPKQGTYGFDTGMFLINALNANGGDFSRNTPPYDGLQNAFEFIRAGGNGGLVNDEMFMINFAPTGQMYKFGI